MPGFDGFDGTACGACQPGTSKSGTGRSATDPSTACADGTSDVVCTLKSL